MSAEMVTMEDGVLRLDGKLVFGEVSGLLRQGGAYLEGTQPLVIDMSGVTKADSAGLALMLEWMDQRRSIGGSIHFRAVPSALLELARLSNVRELLPLIDDEGATVDPR